MMWIHRILNKEKRCLDISFARRYTTHVGKILFELEIITYVRMLLKTTHHHHHFILMRRWIWNYLLWITSTQHQPAAAEKWEISFHYPLHYCKVEKCLDSPKWKITVTQIKYSNLLLSSRIEFPIHTVPKSLKAILEFSSKSYAWIERWLSRM